jgi:hypothetical protein
MRRLLTALALPLSLLLIAPATPAQAATTRFTDPAGDGAAGDRLDITEGVLRNRDRQIVVETSYAQVSRGALIVFLQARNVKGTIRVVGRHRRNGEDVIFLLNRRGQRQDCAGLRLNWDAAADTSRMRLPSRCFHAGDYGALRMFLLTEVDGGSDADVAPGRRTQSEWVTRG